MAKPVGTLGVIDTLTVGSSLSVQRVFTDLTTLIILSADVIAGNSRCTFRKHTGSAGYTPSGATTFKVAMIGVQCTSATNTAQWQIGYADADIGIASATAHTNPVRIYGATVAGQAFSKTNTQGEWSWVATNFVVPNGKYLWAESSAAAGYGFIAYGYEV